MVCLTQNVSDTIVIQPVEVPVRLEGLHGLGLVVGVGGGGRASRAAVDLVSRVLTF